MAKKFQTSQKYKPDGIINSNTQKHDCQETA